MSASFALILTLSLGSTTAPADNFVVAQAPGASSSVVVIQDDEEPPKPDKRPEVKALIKQLSGFSKDRKGEHDDDAVATIDELLQEFPESGEKDRAAIVKAVASAVTFKRQATEAEEPRQAVQTAAATALGRMGPESVGPLIKLIGHKGLREAVGAHAAVLKSVGRLHPDKGVSPLIDMLNHNQNMLSAAAAMGLAGYVEADQKIRKDIFEALLKEIMPLEEAVVDGDDGSADYEEARTRYDTVSASMRDALQAVSGYEERDFAAFRDWWNDNKKNDWDKGR